MFLPPGLGWDLAGFWVWGFSLAFKASSRRSNSNLVSVSDLASALAITSYEPESEFEYEAERIYPPTNELERERAGC